MRWCDRLYRRRRFTEVQALFAEAPEDLPSRLLAQRSAALARTPPPADWDGVYALNSK